MSHKSFYKGEVSVLQDQINDLKKDFSYNLGEVKHSLAYGFNQEDSNTSYHDADLEDFRLTGAEESSNQSRNSKRSMRNRQALT